MLAAVATGARAGSTYSTRPTQAGAAYMKKQCQTVLLARLLAPERLANRGVFVGRGTAALTHTHSASTDFFSFFF